MPGLFIADMRCVPHPPPLVTLASEDYLHHKTTHTRSMKQIFWFWLSKASTNLRFCLVSEFQGAFAWMTGCNDMVGVSKRCATGHYWWFVRKGMFFVFIKNSWFCCLLLVKWREVWDKLVKQINKGMIKKYFPPPPPWNVWSELMALSNHMMLKSRKNIFFLLLQCIFI